jgi:ABC-type multidrug transport system fused ATPase/permease subunit
MAVLDEASDEEVARAAEIAQARDFILAMPEGFQSTISRSAASRMS